MGGIFSIDTFDVNFLLNFDLLAVATWNDLLEELI